MEKDNAFKLVLDVLGGGNPGGIATVFRMISSDSDDANDDNLRMMNILYSKGIYGGAFYMIYKDGCNENCHRFRKGMRAIIDGTISMIDLQVAILKEDRELFRELFKEIKI